MRAPDGQSRLIDILDLERLEPGHFVGPQPKTDMQRVFGGQVVAQALVAGARTVGEGYEVHSLHSYFVRPGDYTIPIEYHVEELKSGVSFCTRRVTASQRGKVIYTQHSSFQRPETGYEHQIAMPTAAGPEGRRPFSDILAQRGNPLAAAWERAWASLDVRWLEDSGDLREDPDAPSMVRLWIRVLDDLPDDRIVHAAAFAYASDISLLGSTLLKHVVDHDHVQTASLDHSIWFHQPFRSDEWWLYDQVSPVAEGSRGFARAEVFSSEGHLVASVAQEVLIRPSERL